MTQHSTAPGTPEQPTAPAATTTISTGTSSGTSPRGGREPGLVGRSVAEAAGSFLVIMVGLGATMLATEAALQPSLVFGLAVVAAMIAFGHVSGGHFNPAITLGSAVAGRTAWAAVLPYLLAQLLGAVAAAGLIWLVLSSNSQLTTIDAFFGSASNGFADHSPAGFPLTSAFLIEVVAAALLVAVFLGAGARGAVRGLAPVAVGLTYAGLISFLLPVTNGGINPIRSAASAIFAESWALEQLWLFWVAPLLGGVIVGLVYRSVDWASREPRTDDVPADQLPSVGAGAAADPLTTVDPMTTAESSPPVASRAPADEHRRNSTTAAFFEPSAADQQPTAEQQAAAVYPAPSASSTPSESSTFSDDGDDGADPDATRR